MPMIDTSENGVLPAPQQSEEPHHGHLLHGLMLGTALAAGALILAPYVLPAVGFGTAETAMTAITALHGTGMGVGLAGAINTGLNAIPFVGPALAEGGIAAAATSGIIGIGGVLLGKFIEKKRNGQSGINWGKVITFGALATSALIALPSVLTGISMGIAYLAIAFSDLNLAAFSNVDIAAQAITMMRKTLGAIGSASGVSTGLSGAAAALPHLLLCGGALLPAALSFKLAGNKREAQPQQQRLSAQTVTANPAPLYTDGSILAGLEVDRPTSAHVPVTAKLRLTDARTGLPVTDDELAITHTRKLHLYVTDESLNQYHHVHPLPTGEPGVLAFSFTPETSNAYSAWADFTLMKDGSNHRLKLDIPAAVNRNLPVVIRTRTQVERDGLVFHWRSSGPLQENTPAIVEVDVTDRAGNPVTNLEPVMGAFAHLAGFSADGQHFIHTHPLGAEPTRPEERGGPKLRFHIEPEYAGPTQFYLQVIRNGQEVHVPFGQLIEPPELSAQPRYASPSHAAMHMAM